MSDILKDIELLRKKPQELLEKIGLLRSNPNIDIVNQALGYDAGLLYDLTDYQLSAFIFSIGQYLVFIQFYKNEVDFLRISISKRLEFELNKSRYLNKTSGAKITEKERGFLELAANPDLMEAADLVSQMEGEATLLAGLTDALSEFLNVLKKEKHGRDLEREHVQR